MNKIFYSLSSQDIPAFFEDHLAEFMGVMLKYLTFKNPLLEESSSIEEAGILEKVQTSICEIVHLYCLRYEEEFVMLPKFIEQILSLLATTSLAAKYDLVISMALSVITVVAKRPQYSVFFESTETLAVITEKIILPNIQMRDIEEELFETEPIDYVRRDLEGSEMDSRRKAAEDLIRSLVQAHGPKLIPILSTFISSCIHVNLF